MPAIAVDNPLALPRLPRPDVELHARPVRRIVTARQHLEGAGFRVWRPFPGELPLELTDPFLLLDQIGPLLAGPGEARGAPWHPHRGIETVTYVIDGEVAHHDSNGGGGVIRDGDTQWMTAGSGILHDELPTERVYRGGGPIHGVQLWVNLPARLKFTSPRYQAITGRDLRLVSTADGAGLVRIIAGELGEFEGPGITQTPITYVHASLSLGSEMNLPWNPHFSAFAYVLGGRGYTGPQRQTLLHHQFAIFGEGDFLTFRAAETQSDHSAAWEVLVLGGLRIGEPIVHYGPFVMNTRRQIQEALDDYKNGKLGIVPADQIVPRRFRPQAPSLSMTSHNQARRATRVEELGLEPNRALT